MYAKGHRSDRANAYCYALLSNKLVTFTRDIHFLLADIKFPPADIKLTVNMLSDKLTQK